MILAKLGIIGTRREKKENAEYMVNRDYRENAEFRESMKFKKKLCD